LAFKFNKLVNSWQ